MGWLKTATWDSELLKNLHTHSKQSQKQEKQDSWMRNYDTRHTTAEPKCHAHWGGEVWLRNQLWRNESGTASLSVAGSPTQVLVVTISLDQAGYQHDFTCQARNSVQTSEVVRPIPQLHHKRKTRIQTSGVDRQNSTATSQKEEPNPDCWARQVEFHSYNPRREPESKLLG